MSAWLGRAHRDVTAFLLAAGGDALLSSDERVICNRAMRLIGELSLLEAGLEFCATCDVWSTSIEELLKPSGGFSKHPSVTTANASQALFLRCW